MAYASVDELKAVIPTRDLELLTDFGEEIDMPDNGRIQQALNDASAEIDSYIAKAVKLPLADPPHLLNVICRDLAMHRLYLNLGHDMDIYDKLRVAAIAMLKSIANGEISIGDDGNGDPEITTPGIAMTEGPERVMTRDRLKGY